MYNGARVAVVVPAFNEAGLVADTIRSIPGFVDRIYPIDDASTDGTWAEIESVVDDPIEPRRIMPIRHAHNRGVGAAIKSGYDQAVKEDIDVVAVMAGDGQMPPEYLEHLIQPIVTGRAEYAKGNRLHRLDHRGGMSRWRLFGNALLTMLTRVSSGYWGMTDPQNGYTAISVETLAAIPYDKAYDRYGFANDLLAILNTYERSIVDVCHPARYGSEQSHIRYRSFVPILSWLLLKRFIWRLGTRYVVRGFHPIVPSYLIGVTAVASGIAGAAVSLWWSAADPLIGLIASITVVLLGTVLLVLAMWFDVDHNQGLIEIIDPGPAPHEPTSQPVPEVGLDRDYAVSDGGQDEGERTRATDRDRLSQVSGSDGGRE